MKSKIIYLHDRFFKRKKQAALTSLMIETLLAAYAKQKEKMPFGPGDIKRSCTVLINRGLIIRKEVWIHANKKMLWQVTNEAIIMLQTMGFDVAYPGRNF